MADMSNSGNSSLRPLNVMEDQEWTDTKGYNNESSSAGVQGNPSYPNSSDPLAAQLEVEFRQFLVERGTYKELEKTASRVLLKLLQAKRADGSPLLLLNTNEVSSKENNVPTSVPPSAKKKILQSTDQSGGCTRNKKKESKGQNNCQASELRGTIYPSNPVEWLDQVVFQKEKA